MNLTKSSYRWQVAAFFLPLHVAHKKTRSNRYLSGSKTINNTPFVKRNLKTIIMKNLSSTRLPNLPYWDE